MLRKSRKPVAAVVRHWQQDSPAKPPIAMNFPSQGLIDCVMSLKIHLDKVDDLAWNTGNGVWSSTGQSFAYGRILVVLSNLAKKLVK